MTKRFRCSYVHPRAVCKVVRKSVMVVSLRSRTRRQIRGPTARRTTRSWCTPISEDVDDSDIPSSCAHQLTRTPPPALFPTLACGSQRVGLNVAPAIAPDGTIYSVSRAHLRSRYSYLLAVSPNLRPKWQASHQHRRSAHGVGIEYRWRNSKNAHGPPQSSGGTARRPPMHTG